MEKYYRVRLAPDNYVLLLMGEIAGLRNIYRLKAKMFNRRC